MQMRQEQQKQQYMMGGAPFNRFMPPGPGGMAPGSALPGGMPPASLPSYSPAGPVTVPPMYAQPGHPSYMGHQIQFAGHMPQGDKTTL